MRLLIVYIAWLSLGNLYGQPASIKKKAEHYFINGFQAFRNKDYEYASSEFEKVLNLQQTPHTAPANYYKGLTLIYAKKYEEAIPHFQYIIDQAQNSPFIEDAIYHKALAMLQIPEKREGGLYLLFNLLENTAQASLKNDINNLVSDFLFHASIYFLEKYYEKVRPQYKNLVAEALAYQYFIQKKTKELFEFITQHEKNHTLTPNLKNLKRSLNAPQEVPQMALSETLKIAVVLPLNSNEYSEESAIIKPLNQFALEFLYGLEYALNKEPFSFIKQIELKVFDSQKDTNFLKQIIQKDIKAFLPDVVIGDMFASGAQLLANFCEQNQILHLVPFTQTDYFLLGKTHSFLCNPSFVNQTAGIAKWLKNQKNFKHVVAIFDEHAEGKRSAEIFNKELDNSLKNDVFFFETSTWQRSLKSIQLVMYDTLNPPDAIFMNIQKPEHFETILNEITRSDTLPFTLITVNDIKNLTRISGKKWAHSQTIFTNPPTTFIPNKPELKSQLNIYTQENYHFRNSLFFFQAIDLVELLKHAIKEHYQGKPWNEVFKNMKALEGINQNYFFGNNQNNLSIQLFQFQKDGIKKLDIW